MSSSSSSSSTANHALWTEYRTDAMARCILPMTSSSYKGSSGRVGVLGGSARYTGAPYYAAMAALKVGADLSFVFCAEEAAIPIKTYSPELMVAPVYSAKKFDELKDGEEKDAEVPIQKMVKEVVDMMDKLHCLVIGPGLGRCSLIISALTNPVLYFQSGPALSTVKCNLKRGSFAHSSSSDLKRISSGLTLAKRRLSRVGSFGCLRTWRII